MVNDTGLANKIFSHERAGFHTAAALQNKTSALVAPPTDIDRSLPRLSCLHSLSESRRCFRLERYWHLPQALWRSDPLIHAEKESKSCRPSVDDRPSTRVNRAATPSSFSFVRSRPLLFERHKKKETPGHSRVELPKRIDRFVVRAAFGVQGSFTAAFPKRVPWPGVPQRLEQRSDEAPSATIAKLRSTTNWALSATSMHRMVAITVKEADYRFQIL